MKKKTSLFKLTFGHRRLHVTSEQNVKFSHNWCQNIRKTSKKKNHEAVQLKVQQFSLRGKICLAQFRTLKGLSKYLSHPSSQPRKVSPAHSLWSPD